MVKKEIRQLYNTRRQQLRAPELEEKAAALLEQFTRLLSTGKGDEAVVLPQVGFPAEQPAVRTLLSYFPLLHRGEFDVDTCRRHLENRYPDLITALPRIIAGTPQMEAVVVNEQTALANNVWGIAEPAGGQVIEPAQIDMVFVPLLAFDHNGFRVGYGKGYYDRYLPRCRPGVLKIGFSFFGPVKQIDDLDEFDVPLNYCITPTRVYEF